MKFDKTLEIERAMVVYAHPDDAEFAFAGTVAKWARAGVEITYVMITNGASGSDDPEITREQLRDTRYAEQRAAAKILGVKHCVFLGYEDGYLYPTIEVRRDVARQVRIHRPDVLIAMDPTVRITGTYVNHPDHIAAGEVALRAVNPDAPTRQMFPELWKDEKLEPHKPKALFLDAFGGGEGTVIDISDTIEIKIKALREHRSQLWPGAEDLVRDWAARTGKAAGYTAGEAFRIVRLEGETEPEKPAARARGRRGVQRQAARSTRAPRKGTASRRKRAR